MNKTGSADVPSASWHSRGYLPHFDGGEIVQSITFRLAGSLPKEVLIRLEKALNNLAVKNVEIEKQKYIESWLDKGVGSRWLKDPRIALMVENALLYFDNERYCLHAWVIMPNHIHVLFTPKGWTLTNIIQSWKSYTAKQANLILSKTGKFWQEDYFDRYIRDERHYWAVLNYIENNPVKAGLCQRKEDWPYGSAIRRSASETLAFP